MKIPAIIFTRASLAPISTVMPAKAGIQTKTQILFCLIENTFPEFDLAKTSPTEFAAQNNLLRHDKFDWYVNKSKPVCFLFEQKSMDPAASPVGSPRDDKEAEIQWLTFPQIIKKITNGTHRNLIQLAVQYISYGMIDDSVIAADYDLEWLKNLQSK